MGESSNERNIAQYGSCGGILGLPANEVLADFIHGHDVEMLTSKMRVRMYSVFVRAPERLKSSISRSWSRLLGKRKWKASHFGGLGVIHGVGFHIRSGGDFGA